MSFKGAVQYVLHDPGKTSADRVGWTETRNLISEPEHAWFEMFDTWRNSDRLKQAAGRDARGRKNTTPVLHYSLSWHTDDQPSNEHMRETALSSLKALGLDKHEAVISAHTDKDHHHVHVVVNTVNPETGMTAPLKFTKRAFSEWALAYEKEHGIRCDKRVEHDELRKAIEAQRAEELEAARQTAMMNFNLAFPSPYIPVKDKSPNRSQWFALKDVRERQHRLRSEMDVSQHKPERQATWARHQQERDELLAQARAAAGVARDYIRQIYRSRFAEMYKEQAQEKQFVLQARDHPLMRAAYILKNSERLGMGSPLSLKNKAVLMFRYGALCDAVDVMHNKEIKRMALAQHYDQLERTDVIWNKFSVKIEALRGRQLAERAVQRDEQRLDKAGIDFAAAKANLIEEALNPDAVRRPAPIMPTPPTFTPMGTMTLSPEEFRRRFPDWNRGRQLG